MPTTLKRICVFCGSREGVRPAYRLAAIELARSLAEQGIGLVYGGGNVGLMGEIARAALAAGGEVIGVIPRFMQGKELAHHGLTELRLVDTMHERKALMADLSNGFIALPGGFGTYDELFEILTWAQIGLHGWPIGLLDVDGYFAPLRAMVAHAVEEGFVAKANAGLLLHDTSASGLLDRMRAWQPIDVSQWADRKR